MTAPDAPNGRLSRKQYRKKLRGVGLLPSGYEHLKGHRPSERAKPVLKLAMAGVKPSKIALQLGESPGYCHDVVARARSHGVNVPRWRREPPPRSRPPRVEFALQPDVLAVYGDRDRLRRAVRALAAEPVVLANLLGEPS